MTDSGDGYPERNPRDIIEDDTPDTVPICPECGKPHIERRTSDTTPSKWLCNDCHHTFDDPAERERDDTRLRQDSLAWRLLQANADEVGP